MPETDALLQRVVGMIAGARALPLSSSVKLDNKEEILELLREASERLPEELRQARWMLKEREEYLAATQRKAEELVESARSEAQRLVQRTEILKEAQAQARRAVEEAREEARRLRLEAEDYADQKLAQFEIVLERTLKTVASGRQKLSGLPDKEDEVPVNPFEGLGRPASPGNRASGLAGASGTAGLVGTAGTDKRRIGSRPPGRYAEGAAGGTERGAGGTGRGSPSGPARGRPIAGSPAAGRPGASSAGLGSPGRRGPLGTGAPGEGAVDGPGGDESFFDQDSL